MNILQEAENAVYGDREADYGSVLENFTTVAKLWSVVAKVELTPEQVGLMMVQLKVARQMNKAKRDNLVDGAGYFATLEKMEEERKGTTDKPDNTRQALDKFPSLINIWNSRIADKSCTMEYVSNKIGMHDSIGYGLREIRFDYFGTDVQIVLERNSSGFVFYKLGESKYDLPLDMGEKLCKEFDEIFKTSGIK